MVWGELTSHYPKPFFVLIAHYLFSKLKLDQFRTLFSFSAGGVAKKRL